jgi:formylglycine-generating enzyme required for sulfatase activity
MKKILFENLPKNIIVRDLLDILDPLGTVQWALMVVNEREEPTGQGYVQMWSNSEAELVVAQWSGQALNGSTLKLRVIEENEDSPDNEQYRRKLLNTPSQYIYSVIRYEINAPPETVVFVNDLPKEIVDENGVAVVRGLLPGSYEIKLIAKNQLIAYQQISVNCDEEIEKLVVELEDNQEALPELPQYPTGRMSAYRTQTMSAVEQDLMQDLLTTKRSGSLPPPQTVGQSTPTQVISLEEQPRRTGLWLTVGSLTLVALVATIVLLYRTPETVNRTPEGMIRVPGGKIIIGRISGTDDYEKPAHEVTIPNDYYIDKLEVTNEDYLRFVQDAKHTPPPHWENGVPTSAILRLPVTQVNWDDAQKYCQWKGARVGFVGRLPHETEWENAARGEKNLLYVWGNDWQEGYANANHKTGQIAPVGSNPRDVSPYGVLDMMGNVREWTSDSLTIYPGSKAQYVSQVRVTRGGAYSDQPENASSTFRNFYPPNFPPDKPYDRIGFRCLCEIVGNNK